MSKGDSNRLSASFVVGCIALLTAFVIGTTLIWALSENGPQAVANTYQGSEHHERAKDAIASTCVGVEVASLAECVIEIDQTARENHYTQKDVRAQRYMAIWAFLMAYAALGTLGVTTVGLIWIKGTLDQTREAVRAADDAVEATDRVGKAQAQAYVSVVGVEQTNDPVIMLKDELVLRVYLKNSGKTPAKHISGEIFVTIEDPEFMTELKGSHSEEGEFFMFGLESGATQHCETSVILPYADYSLSQRSTFISGILRYETFFGDRFISEFQFSRSDDGGFGSAVDEFSRTNAELKLYQKHEA